MAEPELPHRADDTLAAAVARIVRDRLGGGGLWDAHARDGHVVVCRRHGDPLELHLATIIVAAVVGVLSVDCVSRGRCPHH